MTGAASASPFAGNVIPADRINPIAAAYAALYPMPNRPGTVGNYFTNQLRPYDYNAGMGRVDHNFNSIEPPLRDRLLEQAPGGPLQLGAGCENATDGGIIGGIPDHPGLRLPDQHGLTHRLHLDPLADARCSTCAASGARFGEWRDPARRHRSGRRSASRHRARS